MTYYNKYIKYKIKYLNILESKIGGMPKNDTVSAEQCDIQIDTINETSPIYLDPKIYSHGCSFNILNFLSILNKGILKPSEHNFRRESTCLSSCGLDVISMGSVDSSLTFRYGMHYLPLMFFIDNPPFCIPISSTSYSSQGIPGEYFSYQNIPKSKLIPVLSHEYSSKPLSKLTFKYGFQLYGHFNISSEDTRETLLERIKLYLENINDLLYEITCRKIDVEQIICSSKTMEEYSDNLHSEICKLFDDMTLVEIITRYFPEYKKIFILESLKYAKETIKVLMLIKKGKMINHPANILLNS